MAINAYEVIATKNAQMAKFLDENHEIARCFKKMIGLLVNIASDWRVDASSLRFEVMASPEGKMLIVRVLKQGES